ncbi:unnamed protein product [Camellia sinensis]
MIFHGSDRPTSQAFTETSSISSTTLKIWFKLADSNKTQNSHHHCLLPRSLEAHLAWITILWITISLSFLNKLFLNEPNWNAIFLSSLCILLNHIYAEGDFENVSGHGGFRVTGENVGWFGFIFGVGRVASRVVVDFDGGAIAVGFFFWRRWWGCWFRQRFGILG